MSEVYHRTALVQVEFDFEKARLAPNQTHLNLSRKDVLGIVQSAFAEIGPINDRMVAAKRDVLDEVAKGKLADALRTAIVGAGRAGCR